MKQNREIWRDIPDYEGYYEASNLGRIRSLDRWVIYKNGRKQFYKGRFFKDSLNVHGYKQVGLSRDGKTTNFLTHQLVAMAFLDHEPNGHTLVVDHINGIRTDNRVENLQIVTNRDNLSTCYRANEDSFTSDFVGVNYHKHVNKWQSRISFNSKRINLGYYNNEEDASNAYQKALGEINDDIFNPENYKPKWTSNYKGICYYKNTKKWLCQPTINGEQIHLGYYNNEEDASNAYQKALNELENGTFKIEDYRASFTSNYKGITFHKATQKWVCQPTNNGKQIYLGRFENEEEAYQMILLFESAQPIVNNS